MADHLKATPLDRLHRDLGARMVPFAGYSMPLQYPTGILAEHTHCRQRAGLFDVSHMGQIAVRPRSGELADAALALERLVPVDVLGLSPGRQRYAFFTNAEGGILDDLMAANLGDRLVLVVNAACKDADFAHLSVHLGDVCEVAWMADRALLALQGPEAAAVLAAMAPEAVEMRFMDVAEIAVGGLPCIVSRSGYTGEDGFEISVPAAEAEGAAKALLAEDAVAPVGLGARDSLRLEAGLCLYGSDLDTTTTPVEASLTWAIQKVRRADGAREGGFPGATRILRELADGPGRRRVGLRPDGKAPIRAGAPLFAAEAAPEQIGAVTSGVFGPTVGGPVAIGYVAAGNAGTGTRLLAEVRGKRLPVTVVDMPFVPAGYKR